MKKESPKLMKNRSCAKQLMREELIKIRKGLCEARKKQAAHNAYLQLSEKLKPYKSILSFYSIKNEININLLNQDLFKEHKLLLPKIEDTGLSAHKITKFEFISSAFGILEPHPEFSIPIPLEQIDCILVPALGFDRLCHRIGYGKGHYDQFLEKLKKDHFKPYTIGIGFQEQLCIKPLPAERHDIALDELLLF
ncbi:putative 5-formyltetrahydrofolate cyclo-ligase [Candidatus Rhabdochlamydia sp. T3358]|nr:putative 5-formyltetrahydrofolate cyclo-ligase [Candidatus Rhabdochlamydia sp. T3358]